MKTLSAFHAWGVNYPHAMDELTDTRCKLIISGLSRMTENFAREISSYFLFIYFLSGFMLLLWKSCGHHNGAITVNKLYFGPYIFSRKSHLSHLSMKICAKGYQFVKHNPESITFENINLYWVMVTFLQISTKSILMKFILS